jgi:ribulose-phosphate 3-epimerase
MGAGVRQIEEAGGDFVHIDVMDGNFVPDITFGPKMVRDLRPLCSLPFDVHLMTEHPETHIPAFACAGADYITFPVEAATHAHHTAMMIREAGKKCGISIVPSTPVTAIVFMLQFVDLVLVMTVNPGWGGQQCIPECFQKVQTLDVVRKANNLPFLISVDGGINAETAPLARKAGADILVAGSAFFSAEDKAAVVRQLRG